MAKQKAGLELGLELDCDKIKSSTVSEAWKPLRSCQDMTHLQESMLLRLLLAILFSLFPFVKDDPFGKYGGVIVQHHRLPPLSVAAARWASQSITSLDHFLNMLAWLTALRHNVNTTKWKLKRSQQRLHLNGRGGKGVGVVRSVARKTNPLTCLSRWIKTL